jgi:hypothetical protein
MPVRAGALTLLLLSALLPSRGSAQERVWGIGVDVGLTRFWGGSEPVPPNAEPGFKPYRPTTASVRLDRVLGRARAGLTVSYAASGLAVETEDAALVAKGALTWVQLAPEAAYRLATLGPVTELRIFGGPVADLWIPNGDDTRARIGGRAGLELLVPLSEWIGCTLRAHGGLTGSLFREADVPSGFRAKTMPNAGVSVGVRFGL